jgi:hypothetical protein
LRFAAWASGGMFTSEMCNEEREADADWCKEGAFMLLDGEHEAAVLSGWS